MSKDYADRAKFWYYMLCFWYECDKPTPVNHIPDPADPENSDEALGVFCAISRYVDSRWGWDAWIDAWNKLDTTRKR